MNSRTRPIDRPLALPAWARAIEARESGEDLEVLGEGAEFEPVPTARLAEKRYKDQLQAYYRFVQAATEKRSGKRPPHMQFVNATNDERLTEFVREHGPIAAKEARYEAGEASVRAVQNLEVLRREQRIFSCAVRLFVALDRAAVVASALFTKLRRLEESMERERENRIAYRLAAEKRADLLEDHLPRFKEICDALRQLAALTNGGVLPHDPSGQDQSFPWGDFSLDHTWFAKNALESGDYEGVLWFGHRTLCVLFDKFPCRLHYEDGRVMELPEHTPFGIRPALYFMLRSDYQRGREIQICQRTDCGQSFFVERAGGQYCSPRCSKLQRQRDYWDETGAARRRVQIKAKQQK